MCHNLCRVKVLEEAIEVIKVRWIVDLRYHPVESYKYRHLYEEWYYRAHRIDSFSLVELKHLHTECCLIFFVFFLEGFYLWLYLLELLLSFEHVVLRNEEDETYDDSDDDDGPTEWMSREPCQECYKEVVYGLIDCCREEASDDSRFFSFKKYYSLTVLSIECNNILACVFCEYLIEWSEWNLPSCASFYSNDITESWSRVTNILDLSYTIKRYLDICTWIDRDTSC